MKRSILSMLLMLVAIASLAQERLISGKITDRDTKDPVCLLYTSPSPRD